MSIPAFSLKSNCLCLYICLLPVWIGCLKAGITRRVLIILEERCIKAVYRYMNIYAEVFISSIEVQLKVQC